MNITNDQIQQALLIENYNTLAKWLEVMGYKTITLNEAGVCAGLAKMYLFYAKQNQREAFFDMLAFLAGLNEKNVKAITTAIKKKKTLKININKKPLLLKKIIRFIETVSLVQAEKSTLSFNTIAANWEDTVTLITPPENLAEAIRNAGIENYELIFVSIRNPHESGHAIAIERQGEKYIVYDPNNPQKPIVANNYKEIAAAILKLNKDLLHEVGGREKIILQLNYLSYGDQNREIVDIFYQVKQNIDQLSADNQILFRLLLEEYESGNASRMSLTLFLTYQVPILNLQQIIPNSYKILADYVKKRPELTRSINSLTKISGKAKSTKPENDPHFIWLYYAAATGQLQEVAFLLRKIDASQVLSEDAGTAVEVAAYAGHSAIVELLLKNGSSPNNAFLSALEGGHATALGIALQHGADPNQSADELNNPPVIIAAESNNLALLEKLILANAKLDAANIHGETALYRAAVLGHTQFVKTLLENGASAAVFSQTSQSTPLAKDKTLLATDKSPLYQAAKNGHLEIVSTLIQAGADPHWLFAINNTNALYVAAANGYSDTVMLLLGHHAKADISNSQDGSTPLSIAIKNNHWGTMKMLLTHDPRLVAQLNQAALTQLVHFSLAHKSYDLTIIALENSKQMPKATIKQLTKVIPKITEAFLHDLKRELQANAGQTAQRAQAVLESKNANALAQLLWQQPQKSHFFSHKQASNPYLKAIQQFYDTIPTPKIDKQPK